MKTGNIFSNQTLSDLFFSKHSFHRQLMAWGRTPQTMSNYTCEISASEYPLLFPEKNTTPVINAMMATLVLTSIGWFIYNFYLRKVNINCTCWRSVEDFLNKSLTVILFIFNVLNLTSIAVTETLKAMNIDWFLNKKVSSSANFTFVSWISLSILNAIFSSILVYGIRRRRACIIKIYLLWANALFVIWVVMILLFSYLSGIFDQIVWIVFLAMTLINISILLFVHFVGNVVILYSIILGEKNENELEMTESVSAQSNEVHVISDSPKKQTTISRKRELSNILEESWLEGE